LKETPTIELLLHPDPVTPGPEIPAACWTEPDAFHIFIENIFRDIVTGRFLRRNHQGYVTQKAPTEPVNMTGFQSKRLFQLGQLLIYAIIPDKNNTFQQRDQFSLAGQGYPSLLCHLTNVVDRIKRLITGIKTKNPEPSGKSAQHDVRYKPHWSFS
jgi:hypothetical protein